MSPSWEASADVVVVGSGVAGLTCALDAAAAGLSVVVVTKRKISDGNTAYAQGGIAVVTPDSEPDDCVEAHVLDTLIAGAGLCEKTAVAGILAAGGNAVARLQARGMRFDADGRGPLRTREGGHRANRVIHAGGDATGAEVQRVLSRASAPAVLTDHLAVDAVLDDRGRVSGLDVLDAAGTVGRIASTAVVLATGGSGQLYAASTNPAVATADGVAIGLRAGAAVADLEFVQFHPTALWTAADTVGRRDLVTEALRGAGAVLVDASGRRLMGENVHPLRDLAPRDVVSLELTRHLAQTGADCAYLNCTGVPDVVRRFPTVAAACAAVGLRLQSDAVPVSPAAHYQCGGLWTDLAGRTTVAGLYAAGEVARTGLHGANRLASNSLLEGLVMGERVARTVSRERRRLRAGGEAPATKWASAVHRSSLQSLMSRFAGVGRCASGLETVIVEVQRALVGRAPLSVAAVEATNLAQVSALLATMAAERTETRGCHVRTEAPAESENWRRSLYGTWADGPVVHRRRPPAAVAPVALAS